MVDYLRVCCEEGESIVAARSTVYGYKMLKLDSNLPEKLLLPQSKAALKGWSSRFPRHSRAGVDLQVWDVIAWKCIEQRDSLAAAAILLQGDTYMRPHEILHVRVGSVIKPSKSKARFWGVVIGDQSFREPTKTGPYDDCVLFNSPGRTDLGVILKALLIKTETKNDFIFQQLTLSAYNHAIKIACDHSGPSSDVLRKVRSIDAIQQRGRWAAMSSVTRYQKPGRVYCFIRWCRSQSGMQLLKREFAVSNTLENGCIRVLRTTIWALGYQQCCSGIKGLNAGLLREDIYIYMYIHIYVNFRNLFQIFGDCFFLSGRLEEVNSLRTTRSSG